MSQYTVKAIENKECYPFLLDIHYAKRIPSISYSFGLFEDDTLVGVVCYGTPPSSTLRRGIAGDENIHRVLELNRLCLVNNKKNEASMLVGRSLRLLPKNKIIVSFADTEQHHLGIVYQATNFKYYGLSAKRTDWKVAGQEHLHGQTIADQFRHLRKGRAAAAREFYGDKFYLKERSRKHRYVYITGNGDYSVIKYKEEAYPRAYKNHSV